MIGQFFCHVFGLVSFSCDFKGIKLTLLLRTRFCAPYWLDFYGSVLEQVELSEGLVLCHLARHFILTVPFSAKMLKSVNMVDWGNQ